MSYCMECHRFHQSACAPEKAPAPDLVGELVAALGHVVYSNHEFAPDSCSGCAQAQRLLSTKHGAIARQSHPGECPGCADRRDLARAKEQGR